MEEACMQCSGLYAPAGCPGNCPRWHTQVQSSLSHGCIVASLYLVKDPREMVRISQAWKWQAGWHCAKPWTRLAHVTFSVTPKGRIVTSPIPDEETVAPADGRLTQHAQQSWHRPGPLCGSDSDALRPLGQCGVQPTQQSRSRGSGYLGSSLPIMLPDLPRVKQLAF